MAGPLGRATPASQHTTSTPLLSPATAQCCLRQRKDNLKVAGDPATKNHAPIRMRLWIVNGSEAQSSWLAASDRRPEAGSHIHGAYFTPPAISCTTRNNQPADA